MIVKLEIEWCKQRFEDHEFIVRFLFNGKSRGRWFVDKEHQFFRHVEKLEVSRDGKVHVFHFHLEEDNPFLVEIQSHFDCFKNPHCQPPIVHFADLTPS